MPARSRRWSRMVRPHVAHRHQRRAGPSRAFRRCRGDRRRQGGDLRRPRARRRRHPQPRHRRISSGCCDARRRLARRRMCSSFGDDAGGRRAAAQLRAGRDVRDRTARCLRPGLCAFALGAPGRHMAINALAVLLAAARASALDLDAAAAALAFEAPPRDAARAKNCGSTRAADSDITADRRKLQRQSRVHARRDRACWARRSLSGQGRRIAVLGDMLELGPTAALTFMSNWLSDLEHNRVDLVFGAGPLTRHLFDALPPAQGAAPGRVDAAALEPLVAEALRRRRRRDGQRIERLAHASRLSRGLKARLPSGKRKRQFCKRKD